MVSFKRLRKMIEVKGNGNIVSKEIKVSSFLLLHIWTVGNVRLVQSNEEKVIIETDENLLEYCDAQNSGGTLFVYSGSKIRNIEFTKCDITIFTRQINKIDICQVGDMICQEPIVLANPLEIKIQSIGNTELNIEAPLIKLNNQSQGNLTIKGKCENIQIKNQSIGDFYAKELIAQDLKIKNMAQGNVELYAQKNICISNNGVGSVFYWGDAVLKDIKGYGQIFHKE